MVAIAESVPKPASRFRFILDRRDVLGCNLRLAGDPLRAVAGRRAVPAGGVLLGQRLHDLRSVVAIRRPGEFRADIIENPDFRQTLSNTFIFTFGSQILGLILGKFGALVLLRPFPGRKFVRAIIILPWAVPVALATVAWQWMFDSLYSVINWTMIALGFITRAQAPNWLGNPDLAMLSVIVVNAWRFFPFAIVIFLAGITAIPQDVLDAATVDGAGFWRRNYQIIVPMILPIVAIGLIFGIVFTFTDLSIVFLHDHGRSGRRNLGAGLRGFPDRHRFRRRVAWRRHLAVHAAGAARRGDLDAALHPAAGDLTCRAPPSPKPCKRPHSMERSRFSSSSPRSRSIGW